MWRALAGLKQDTFVQLGLVLQETKTTVFAPLGAPSLETKPPSVKVGVGVGIAAARVGIIGHGVVNAGNPICPVVHRERSRDAAGDQPRFRP